MLGMTRFLGETRIDHSHITKCASGLRITFPILLFIRIEEGQVRHVLPSRRNLLPRLWVFIERYPNLHLPLRFDFVARE